MVLPTPGTSSISRCPRAIRHDHGPTDRGGLALDHPLDVLDQPADSLLHGAREPLSQGTGYPGTHSTTRLPTTGYRLGYRQRLHEVLRKPVAGSRQPFPEFEQPACLCYPERDEDHREDVRHVAALARLDLSAAEEEKRRGELGAILGYVEKLARARYRRSAADGARLRRRRGAFATTRSATVPPVDALLANAPDRWHGFFRVPKIIE